MRIALLAPPWVPVPPPLYGGTELVIDLLARGYAAAGHDVRLFATGDSECPVPQAFVYERAQGTSIGMTESELRQVTAAYSALEGYDVIHDHTMLGPFLAPAGRAQVVHTIHLPLEGDRLAIYERVPGHVRLVAVSKSQHRHVPQLNVATVIHHGIDAARFPFQGQAGDYGLFLGRMAQEKGVDIAIRAAQKAGVPLVMAGKMRSAEEILYFEQRIKPLMSDGVTYLGEVSDGEKIDLLRGALCLLFPTQWSEPFGMVMLEAMACGTPVLATIFGAVPEVVTDGETGFLCRDVGEMAEAIGRCATFDRAACRRSVEVYFSAERMTSDYLNLFRLLTGGA
ncbi:MAG TPA: glycosyltransferase family 4 protein [Acidimicrobiales bacterium]